MKILAVDDDQFILELLVIMANRAGYTEVSTASSGEVALEMLTDVKAFDCLLFDISMPDMDGIELCGVVREIPAYSQTPIIMLTAVAEKGYVDRAFRSGATDYASKPLDIVELQARLRVAEKLVMAQQAIASATATVSAQESMSPQGQSDKLSSEVRVEGVKNLVEHEAFKNCLNQLSQAGLASSQVVAIKVDHIEKIYSRASANEFLYALAETADAISGVLQTSGYLMSYAGNGIFFVIADGTTLNLSLELETEIQHLLDERDTEYDNGDPMDIEISIGNSIRPRTSKTEHSWVTLDRAIARAEKRVLRKHTEPKPPNIRRVGG